MEIFKETKLKSNKNIIYKLLKVFYGLQKSFCNVMITGPIDHGLHMI